MASIIESLRNAEYNLQFGDLSLNLVREQLHNAVELLDKGYSIYTQIEPLLDEYGSVDDVPDVDDNPNCNQDD